MKNKLRRTSFLIALAFSLVVAALHWEGAFVNFENKSLDFRFKLRGTQQVKAPIAVAGIDEDSLKRVSNWPWRRSVHAKLVDVLRKAGAKAVVFDVLFYEPSKEHPEDDRQLARSIQKSGNTISAVSFEYFEQQISTVDAKGKTIIVQEPVVSRGEPLPVLAENSRAIGFVNCFPDPDGYLRRAPLLYWYEGDRYESLNLLSVAVAQGRDPEEIVKELPTADAVNWGYPSKEVLINYRGPVEGTFTTFSCADLLDGAIPEEWLKGKIIIVGSTALGLYDHYPTPFSASFPGLYFHANVIDNIWAKDFLKPLGPTVTLAMIFAFGLALGLLVPKFSAWLGAVTTLSLTALLWLIGYWLMAKRLVYIELVAPTIGIVGSYMAVFFYRFIVEQKEKAGIKKAFGVYVNPHVVDQIAKNPDALKLGGEMREMTVMFSDVAGFTTISEKLSPQELVQLLNLYLTAMTDTIMKYDGTVDKYEGDAIMAFWGAPLVQPSHAKQACRAVLENRQRLAELNVELEKKGMNKLAARCGINTGPMNVGNMGSAQKFNYTVMGDAVNLASRMEGANKQYDTTLMISESTYAQAKDEVEVRELDLLRVKGKKLPIKVFELVCKKGELTDGRKKGFELYHEGLALYRQRKFKEALKKFDKVLEFLDGDGPTKTYSGRIKNYLETPPPDDWDGVFVMTTK